MLRPDEALRRSVGSPMVPTEGSEALIEAVAQRIAAYGLEEVAILFLEMHKPLSFLLGQSLLVASPFVAPFLGWERVEAVAEMLSQRENIERLLQRLEELREERESS